MKKLVSVIVPVYNVEKYLKNCVETLINQTYSCIEIILIDDGSKDSCGNICDNFAQSDSRIKVIHKKNEGLMKAWMDGIEIASGEFVFFVDSDDWVEKSAIEIMLNACEKEDADMVIANRIIEHDKKNILKKEVLPSGVYDENEIETKIVPGMINNGNYLGRNISTNRWDKLIKKNLIQQNMKYLDPIISYGEDMNIIMPVILDCKKIVVLEDYLYHYRQNESSIIHTYKKNMLVQLNTLTEKLTKAAFDKNKNIIDQIERNYICMYIEVIKNEFQNFNNWSEVKCTLKSLCENEKVQEYILKHTELHVSGINKLIFKYLKSPNWLLQIIIRVMFIIKKVV